MHADAKQTEFCTYLSPSCLAAWLLNAFSAYGGPTLWRSPHGSHHRQRGIGWSEGNGCLIAAQAATDGGERHQTRGDLTLDCILGCRFSRRSMSCRLAPRKESLDGRCISFLRAACALVESAALAGVSANTPKAMSRTLSLFGVCRDLDLTLREIRETIGTADATRLQTLRACLSPLTEKTLKVGGSLTILTSEHELRLAWAIARKSCINDLSLPFLARAENRVRRGSAS